MIEFEGRLEYDRAGHDAANLYLFTGNATIKRNGALVMGRGAAREVRDLYPGIDRELGDMIIDCWEPIEGRYGLVGFAGPNQNIGVFQVKREFNKRAMFSLIEYSVERLAEYAQGFDRAIYMNYPGVGNGGLLATEVAPLLRSLPNNVFLYRESDAS